mmetsp:Transcript_20638/g.50321  ORF Transcript_20638/g.50321 Transcript_20638/m.50321 type:complete len:120 (-) Transcript_20638:609-968(-)
MVEDRQTRDRRSGDRWRASTMELVLIMRAREERMDGCYSAYCCCCYLFRCVQLTFLLGCVSFDCLCVSTCAPMRAERSATSMRWCCLSVVVWCVWTAVTLTSATNPIERPRFDEIRDVR